MTWIVANTMFEGSSILISDVQVTWSSPNGKRREDCLRKVYAIAPNIACGFSGSVDIGFNLLADMHAFANAYKDEGIELLPREFTYKWFRRGRNIFSSFSESQRRLGCTLIMATFSPTESGKNANNARTDIIILRHKNGFEPEIQPDMKAVSVGSGSSINNYLSFLDGMNMPENRLAIERCRGTLTSAQLLSSMIKKDPKPGVSHHLHCTIVDKNGVDSFPLNYRQFNNEFVSEVTMPNVAECYSDFKAFEKGSIFGVGSAIA